MSIEAMRKALNYIENTEGELGIKLSCGDALREALAAQPPAAPVHQEDAYAASAEAYNAAHFPSSADTVAFTDPQTATDTRLILADQYEAGLRKMEASGYEEWLRPIVEHKLIIEALRFQARHGAVPQPPRKSSVEQEMDDSAEYLRTGINNETQAKQVSVEGLADWFYDHGWEFVVADDEEVVKDLLNSFDITRKSSTLPRPQRATQ